MQLTKREDKITGEVSYFGKHESGLEVYIMPKKDYSKGYALFGTRYGSVDSHFIVPGESEATNVPDGIAHYLEHKMFDQPDGTNAFDEFARLGANANAFTSFNMTAYLFSATANFYESLAHLLKYVQSPHFTPESVEKEQGIIGQEIKMYDDNAGWMVFFNMLECMYHNHPVKLNIAGTVESISHITSDLLYKCYNTFYNLSNMTLVVAADIDVEKAVSVIEESILKSEPKDKITHIYPEEPDTVAKEYKEISLSISQPLMMMGFKDIDVGYAGDRLLKKSIEMDILLEMIFGKSGKLYNELYESGLINNSFEYEYTMQPDYAYTSLASESKEPKKLYDAILAHIDLLNKEGLCEKDFERMKKVVWGDYIRSFNDVENYAHGVMTLLFKDIDYTHYFDVYQTITFDDVVKRFKEHFARERAVLSVVNPV